MQRKAIGWVLAAAALVVGSGDAARAGDPPTKPIVRTPDFEKRVSAAIAKGVGWLRTAVQKDEWLEKDAISVWGGAGPAQVYVTLRTCGVASDDPVAAAVFQAMQRHYAARRKVPTDRDGAYLGTRDYAMICMAIAAHGRPLAASDLFGERACRLDADDTAWLSEIAKYLADTQDPHGAWFESDFARRQTDRSLYRPDDISTLYALLGLKAASRAGIRTNATTWIRSLQRYVDGQEKSPGDGVAASGRGWRWAKRHERSDTFSTAGGVSGVLVCRSELIGDPKLDAALDRRAQNSVRDAITWIADNFRSYVPSGAAGDWRSNSWELLTTFDGIYALERAGDLAQVQRMGDHDWYGRAAEWLIAEQCTSGAWLEKDLAGKDKESLQRIAATCFALLTLQRGTLPVATRAFDDTDVNFAVVPALSDNDFDDFIDLVLSRWRRTADAAVNERFFAKTTAIGPRIVAPLVRRLSSAKPDERASAFTLLQRATGLDNGYDPAAADEARASGVAAWTSWLAANAKTLRFDAASGRIVAGN